MFELLASLVARSLVVAEEHGPESRYRLLETIRQFSEERLGEAGEIERWRARHADYYARLLPRIRHQSHDPGAEVLWARLSADQDNLLAAWSWAIDTGNVDTAFSMLAGFAPSEVRTSYLLLLPGEASLALPGATEHRGYALALAVSAVFASARSDRVGPRSFAGAPPKPTPAAIPRTGESRRPSAQHAQTSRLLQAPSQTPPACPNRRPVSRGPAAISPTRPFSSPSPRAFSYSSVTRQGRFRWRGKRSR